MFVPISPKLKSLGKMRATKNTFSSRHLDSAQVLNVEKLKTNCLLARKLILVRLHLLDHLTKYQKPLSNW
uniref:Uncharacterized protein n=1 Tax=Medicago truncatula TaxID=3880 RepID=A2Q149_MEDTR|nr:hypothetical protein MtrDRAFT_AC147481g40v2 [Medicago truncatula]